MKIFFSHSSREKPLVREVISYLPKKIETWIDEKDLPLGADIKNTIKSTIRTEADLVILFISKDSVESQWVKDELDWALEREKNLGYRFIFPIILDKDAWNRLPEDFQNRKYYELSSFEIQDIKNLSDKLKDELFNWLLDKGKINIYKNDLELSIRPYNIISTDELSLPTNKKSFASVEFTINNSIQKEKNKLTSGLPGLTVDIVNTTSINIELEDVSLYYNKRENIFFKDAIEKEILAISLSSLKYGTTELSFNSNIVIPAKQKKSFDLRGEPFMRMILTKGIKEVKAVDVVGNEYFITSEDIRYVEKYLKYYFDEKTLDVLYKQFNDKYKVEF